MLSTATTQMASVIDTVNAYLQASGNAATQARDRQEPALDHALLVSLFEKLTVQLNGFDSEAGDTMNLISGQIEGSAFAPQCEALDQYVNNYDYTNALEEVPRLMDLLKLA